MLFDSNSSFWCYLLKIFGNRRNSANDLYAMEKEITEQHFKHINRESYGRYIVKLPSKYNKSRIQILCTIAFRRYICLKNCFSKDIDLIGEYCVFLHEYESIIYQNRKLEKGTNQDISYHNMPKWRYTASQQRFLWFLVPARLRQFCL